MALRVPGRLRPRISSTFGTTMVVGRQPNAPAAFAPGEIPGTHFQRLSRPQGTWFCRKERRKKSQVTPPGIDPGTARLVAQLLNHYATPGPCTVIVRVIWVNKILIARGRILTVEPQDRQCSPKIDFVPYLEACQFISHHYKLFL